MNKQIEHCLYLAGLTAQGCWDQLGTYEQQAIEKFGELIVRECAQVANGGWADPGHQIKQHFGVEQ